MRFYQSSNWKTLAKRQLSREPICQGCDVAPAAIADHIVPIKRGGPKRDPANLQSLCRSCHSMKTHAETQNRTWIAPNRRGCDENGIPLDPDHPWQAGGVTSRERMPCDPRPSSKLN